MVAYQCDTDCQTLMLFGRQYVTQSNEREYEDFPKGFSASLQHRDWAREEA
jgi:hypothetical protein